MFLLQRTSHEKSESLYMMQLVTDSSLKPVKEWLHTKVMSMPLAKLVAWL